MVYTCKAIEKILMFPADEIFFHSHAIYSETCVNWPPLGPCFTAGIDSGPVYTVSII
jgi:hypothetical protein